MNQLANQWLAPIAVALALGLLASGCSSTAGGNKPESGQQAAGANGGSDGAAKASKPFFKPFDYQPTDEIPKGKGAFTGKDGSVVIVGGGGIIDTGGGEGGETAETKPAIPEGLVSDTKNRKRDDTYLKY